MSTPSTPLRAASRGTSPLHSEGNEGETAILTPGRKIRALLARFDSDESDDGNIPRNLRNSTGLSKRRASVENPVGYNDEDEDDEDDDFPIAPRGRLAARLQAGPQAAETRGNRVQSLFNRSPTRLNEDDSAQENVSDASEVIPSSQRRQETTPCLSTPSRGERSHPTSSPLFVSQDSPLPRVSRSGYETSGSENESIRPQQRSRLKALVAQKKREREEREQQEAEQRAERARNLENARVQFTSDIEAADEDEDDDGESSRRLTQQSRPARKASKKAMLEMSRETQRMSRNMQLAHQATTKKKFTLNSFIERFNQKCNVEQLSSAPDFISESRDAALASSVNHSDNDHVELDRQSTPPTSPLPHLINDDDKVTTGDKTSETSLLRELLPALAQDLEALGALDVEEAPQKAPSPAPTKIPSAPTRKPDAERPTSSRRVRIQLSRQDVAENQKNDSDSDLEIVTSPAKARKLALFENFSAKSSAASDSLRRLKLLARITSPKKNRALTRADHEAWLLRQARIQAAQEREEKIAALRAKGVIIQTAEEKARLEDDVEDLMEKAREEAEEIARKEKAAKKKGDGEEIAVEIDSEEDLDYHENPDEGEEKVENSDEEEENDNFDEEDEVSDEDQVDGEGRADDQVHIDSGAEDKDALGPAYSQAEDPNHRESTEISQRRRKPKYVVSDDEDEEQATGIVQTPMKPQIPYLGRQETPLIGLSQAFAATLADGQDDDEEQDSLAVLRRMPEFDIGVGDFLEQGSQGIVQHTQQRDSGHIDLLADFTQTDARVLDSPLARTVSDMSQVPEPSQDVGFVMSPFDQRKRFLPSSTVDTVPLQNDESPMAKRPGRRLRRGGVQQVSDSEDNFLVKPSAFDVMRKAAKKPITPFDKKKSNAKEIVDEAAEESEDEYAGLGGASDDESGVEDELDLTMINDNSGEVVNERELAAFNA